MRDVIGADDLEDAAPEPSVWSLGSRTGAWALALAAVVAAVLFAESGEPAPGEPGDQERPSTGGPAPDDRTGFVAGAGRRADAGLRAALAARPVDGETVRTGGGARGDVRLEIRNGGAPLALRALTAEVPGVRFTQLVPPNGVQLGPDERVELVLGFRIDDCAQLRRTGRLVLHVEQSGVQSEVGLTVTSDWEAGTVRQVALDRVLGACPE